MSIVNILNADGIALFARVKYRVDLNYPTEAFRLFHSQIQLKFGKTFTVIISSLETDQEWCDAIVKMRSIGRYRIDEPNTAEGRKSAKIQIEKAFMASRIYIPYVVSRVDNEERLTRIMNLVQTFEDSNSTNVEYFPNYIPV